MKNDNLGFEVIDRLWLFRLVYKYHALSEVVSFQLLFLDLSLDSETDRLTCNSLFNINTFVMNAFDLDRVKLTLLVWP